MKKFITILAAIMVTTFTSVFADVIEKTAFNPDENTLSIEGKLPVSKGGQLVTIQLLRAGYQPEALLTVQDGTFSDIIAYNGAISTDENGAYKSVISGKWESGECVLRVSYRGGDVYTKTIPYISTADTAEILAKINSGSIDDITEIIEENGTVLGIFENVLDIIGAKRAAELIIAERPENGYAALSDAAATVNAHSLTESVNACKNADELRAVILANSQIFSGYKSYYVFDGLNKEKQDFILEQILKNKYKNGTELMNSFDEITALSLIKNTVNHLEVKKAIEQLEEILGVKLSEYDSLSDTVKADKAICGKWYDTVALLRSAINEAVKTDSTVKPSAGGSGGGGGGGAAKSPSFTEDYEINKPDTPIFSDLADVEWAKEAIGALYEKNIISGDGGGTFRPNDNITREEFVKIIVTAFGLYDETAQNDFDDVDSAAWYAAYISSARKAGIISGVSESRFGTGEPITRQDLITISYRTISLFKKLDTSGEITFDDIADFSEYSKKAAAAMVEKGIINGVGDNKFSPKSFATRAQVCKIVYGLLNL